jgi:cell wall-associated NlpC family hydrolase
MGVKSPRLSGLALVMIGAGFVITYAGIKNATVVDTLRSLIKGEPVVGSATSGSLEKSLQKAASDVSAAGASSAAGSTSGSGSTPSTATQEGTDIGFRIADQARKYLGVPYAFGKSGPSGVDCSGLVNLVVGHDLHQPIPGSSTGSYTGHGPTSTTWYAWPGCTTIPRSSCAPGDLVCWIGHIGIAISNSRMISAPAAGQKVHETGWSDTVAPPIIRRLK